MNTFQPVTMSATDELSGRILSSMQLGVLQNLRVSIAEQKLNLEFTPNDVLSYAQQEAFLKGQLEILQYIIDSSASSTIEANSTSK